MIDSQFNNERPGAWTHTLEPGLEAILEAGQKCDLKVKSEMSQNSIDCD